MPDDICWLMLEGQNFAASIFDTQDLSTIRGGSLMLRDLVIVAEDWLNRKLPGQVDRATIGGSVGMWRLRTAPAIAARITEDLQAHLEQHEAGMHLGFGIVAVADDGSGFVRQKSRLRAALQHKRLVQSRVPYPSLQGHLQKVCPVDLVRPVAKDTLRRIKPGPRGKIETSTSVHARRDFGMVKKQTLLREETQLAGDALTPEAAEWLKRTGRPFAMQIASISEGTDKGIRSNLADKICVIALDGNGFGQIQDDMLAANPSLEEQVRFDEGVAELRSTLIARVFSRLLQLDGTGSPSPEEIEVREALKEKHVGEIARFELLLWGGDEIMFIVPARLGWDILQTIAEAAEAPLLGRKVTFSVGAVFCHHDAPIARIKKLADDLANHIKGLQADGTGGRNGKGETLFMVEVLESFDHTGDDLDAHLERQIPKPTTQPLGTAARKAFRVMDVQDLANLQKAAQALANGTGGRVSRGRLRQTAHVLHKGTAPGASHRSDWTIFVSDSAKMLEGDAQTCAGVPKVAEGELANAPSVDRFFVLAEAFWDYLVPMRPDADDKVGAAS